MADHPRLDSPDVFEVRVPVATLWTGPDAPRDIDGPAVADLPDVGAWTASMDPAARKELSGRTLTQLLLGEGVRVLEEQGEWVRVVALIQPSSQNREGYPGWVRRQHLGAPVPRASGATAFVMARESSCALEDGSRLPLSFGTAFWVDETTDVSAGVLLPDDRRGTVPLADVRLAHKKQQPAFGQEDLLGCARHFLGLRYLWGGTSAWGLDCSGLVHLTFRAHGVVLPRDAFDQVCRAEPVPLDDVRPGDLYFFARPGEPVYHVGFVTSPVAPDGTRMMLHAPESGQLVEDAPLAPHRAEMLVSAGRVEVLSYLGHGQRGVTRRRAGPSGRHA